MFLGVSSYYNGNNACNSTSGLTSKCVPHGNRFTQRYIGLVRVFGVP